MLHDDAELVQAKRLKKSWVQDHKIRSKWRAQKKREGLTNQTSPPVGDASNHRRDEANVNSESDASPNRPDKPPTASHNKQSLRDLGRIAYASMPPRTQKVDPSCPNPGRSHNDCGGKTTTGQPNMKLRMNVLLEKIKRDLS